MQLNDLFKSMWVRMYMHGFVVLPLLLSTSVRQSFYEIFLANL